MGLRTFHIFFISVSLALFLFLLGWAGRTGTSWLIILSVAGLACLIPYLRWFFRHMKKIGLR